MDSNKLVGNVLIAGGILLLLVAATADMIGIGDPQGYFGWKQITGCVIGVLDIVAGVLINNRQPPQA